MENDKIEPIRVSSKDLQEENKHRKGFKHFQKGNCHFLHPSLDILDKYDDCELLYELEKKILYVTYANNSKAVLSTNVNTIIETIKKHYGDN